MQKMLWFKIFASIYSLVAIIHLIGLLLLYKAKKELPNQRLLVMNLATAEMFNCMAIFGVNVIRLVKHGPINVFVPIVFTFFFTEIRFTMLHIIFDRFLEIYTNIRYPVIMTNKTMKILFVGHWIVSILFATIIYLLEVLESYSTSMIFAFFSYLILDIIILISFLVTYSYFYLKVKKIRSLESNSVNRPPQNRQRPLFKKFKLPCYIVLTYICFNMTSTILMTYSRYEKNAWLSEMLWNIADVPIVAGFTSDAAIYVLANKNVRKLLIALFRREKMQSSNRVAPTLDKSWK